ncbi:hypothetical protein H4R18_004399 [Coemansia javaensis]|uniref:Myb-like domain-containing protein n=1 Tax=Coemansia javaensis TaxID=2761396 RepID=A0A9W8H4D3_9FUNG|nr:hypothetical protein H4R18_004399 [Coemansia javaensis]
MLRVLGIGPARRAGAVFAQRRFMAAAAAEIQVLADRASECLKKTRAVPWYTMAKEHMVPTRHLSRAFEEGTAVRRHWEFQAAQITALADHLYSEELGRADWGAVAREAEMALVDCLCLFDPGASRIQPRSKPAVGDWTPKELHALHSVVVNNFADMGTSEWQLVGVYMNIEGRDCRSMFGLIMNPCMREDVFEAVRDCLAKLPGWDDVQARLPIFGSAQSLQTAYYKYRHRRDQSASRGNQDSRETASPTKGRSPGPWPDPGASGIPVQPPPYAATVDQEVRRQLQQGGKVDWARVGSVVGESQLRCLEACRVDESKAGWTYHPDTFSELEASRVKRFVSMNYPRGTEPNARALSNFLWIHESDCASMLDLLRGRIVWDNYAANRIVNLRDRGVPLGRIASLISPVLTAKGMEKFLRDKLGPEKPRDMTAEEMDTVSAIVKEYHQKLAPNELCTKVRESVGDCDWTKVLGYINKCAGRLSKRDAIWLRDADADEMVRKILAGKTRIPNLAAALDVSKGALNVYLKAHERKMFPREWTLEEKEKALEYFEKFTGAIDWDHMSRHIGKKTPRQCRTMYKELRRMGLF